MEELSERAKIVLAFDAYLKKAHNSSQTLREQYPETFSMIRAALRMNTNEQNPMFRVDLTVLISKAATILLTTDDSIDYHIERFEESVAEVKSLLDSAEVEKAYSTAEQTVQKYEILMKQQITKPSKPKKKYKSIDPETVTVPKLEEEPESEKKSKLEDKPESKKPKGPTITGKPSSTVRNYMNRSRRTNVPRLPEITSSMIENLRRIKESVQKSPSKYPYKKRHKKYFREIIEDYQYMLRGGNGPRPAEQERNDGKFGNDIETLVNNIINGWEGAREELRNIRIEFDAALDYDPGKLMEYFGLEMTALRIIKKDELPNGLK
jgi:hypothetical protein